MSNNCYMTLMTNEKFLPCVIRCKQAIEHIKSKYPYIVMIPNTFNENIKKILENNNILYKEIQIDKFPSKTTYYADTINKFQIFNFTEYDKICFLDADVILNKNLDEEFDKFNSEEDKIYLYNEYEYESKDGYVLTGLIFIAKPESNFYKDKILSLNYSQNTQFENDEEILDYYFENQRGLRHVPDGVLHFGGYIKPWENIIPRFHSIKSVFLNDDKDTFLKKIDNTVEFLGMIHQWSIFQNSPKAFAYTAIAKDKEDVNKIIKMHLDMKDYGFMYPLVVCVLSNDEELLYMLDKHAIPFRVFNQNSCETLIDKIKLNKKLFEHDYYDICIINNLDLKIKENFDFIFSPTLKKEYKNNFFKRYENDLILINYI